MTNQNTMQVLRGGAHVPMKPATGSIVNAAGAGEPLICPTLNFRSDDPPLEHTNPVAFRAGPMPVRKAAAQPVPSYGGAAIPAVNASGPAGEPLICPTMNFESEPDQETQRQNAATPPVGNEHAAGEPLVAPRLLT